ncbi:MAG TPA: BTAD domain-containing putative transcriptional regulator [Longimicrobiales bacterium]
MIELRTLGVLDVRDTADGGVLQSVLAQPKRAAFLTYLAVSGPSRVHRRDTLLGMFWPDAPEKHARHSLSQAVYLLRRSLGADVIAARGEEELCLSFAHLRCDAVEFDRRLGAGDDAAALELYGGELMAGFHLGDSIEFEKWLSAERLRLQVAAVTATRRLAARAEGAGNALDAIGWLRRAVEWAPYDEALRRDLMARMAQAGDRTGALLEHAELSRRLRRDLELEPASETTALAARIRTRVEEDVASSSAVQPEARVRSGARPRGPVRSERIRRAVRRRALRAGLRLSLAAVALLSVAALIPVWSDEDASPYAEDGGDRIAVLPFDVRGSDELEYLGEGLALLLSAKLDGAGPIRGVDPDAVFNFLERSDAATAPARGREVAARFEAAEYVLGTVIEAGGRISVRIGLYAADGTLRTQASADAADEAGVFALVDEAARALIAVRLGAEAERLMRVAAQTTSSLPALKAYLEGERAYRKGRFAEAVSAFERAAVADSTFALAHYRLSLASLWAEVPDTLPFDADARALRHASRLSEHDRLLLRAYDAWRRGAADEAERIYRNVLATYPDDGEAALMLGETLFHYNPARGRPIAEARDPLERVLRVDPEHWGALWHLLLLAGNERRDDDFRALTQHLASLGPSAGEAVELEALSAFRWRDETRIAAALADVGAGHPLDAHDVAWRLAVYLDDPRAALRVMRAFTSDERDDWFRQNAHVQIAWLSFALGRDREALREIRVVEQEGGLAPVEYAMGVGLPHRSPQPAQREAFRTALDAWRPREGLDPAMRAYYHALADLALQDTTRALLTASRIERAEGYAPFAAWIRAEVALIGGRPAESVRLLESAPLERWFGWASSSPVFGAPNLRWTRAEALRALGRDEEALAWYGTFGEGGMHDLAWLAPAHLRSAWIEERLGRPEAAARHYRAAIELWRDADAGLQPVVQQARARLREIEDG